MRHAAQGNYRNLGEFQKFLEDDEELISDKMLQLYCNYK
jgi:hypothetical protein